MANCPPGPVSENQAQWHTLQSYPVTVGVKKRALSINDSFTPIKQLAGNPLTPGSVLDPVRGATGKKKKKIDDD